MFRCSRLKIVTLLHVLANKKFRERERERGRERESFNLINEQYACSYRSETKTGTNCAPSISKDLFH